MPTRHASHSLEDESRRKFAGLLPSHWTIMDVTPDYGLDLRVEIFDELGHTTGRCFYVQLKATASAASSRTRYIDIGAAHYKYWASLSDPVMLVKYFQPSGSFVLQWAHRFHPRHNPNRPTAKTKRFRFSERSAWRPSSSLLIENEVDFLRTVAAGGVMLPIEVGVSGADGVPDAASQAFSRELRKGLVVWNDATDDRAGHHLYLEADAVVVRSGRVMASLSPRFAGAEVDKLAGDETDGRTGGGGDGRTDEDDDDQEWRADVAAALIGVALAAAGCPGQGCRIIAESPPAHRVGAGGLLYLSPLVTALGRAGRFDLALDLRDKWSALDAPELAAGLASLQFRLETDWRGGLTEEQRRRVDAYESSDSRGFRAALYERVLPDLMRHGLTRLAVPAADALFRLDRQIAHPSKHLERVRIALEARDLDRANEWIDSARIAIETAVGGPWTDSEVALELTVLSARRFLLGGDFDSALVQACCIGGANRSAGRQRALTMTALLLKHISNSVDGTEPWPTDHLADILEGGSFDVSDGSPPAALAQSPCSENAQHLAYMAALHGNAAPVFALPLCVSTWSDLEWWLNFFGFNTQNGQFGLSLLALDFIAEVFEPELLEAVDLEKHLGPAVQVFTQLLPGARQMKKEDSVLELVLRGPTREGSPVAGFEYNVRLGEVRAVIISNSDSLEVQVMMGAPIDSIRQQADIAPGRSAIVVPSDLGDHVSDVRDLPPLNR